MTEPCDVALVSLGTTPGLRRADAALAELIADCGASCRLVPVEIGAAGRLRRHIALTDLVEALAARRAARGVAARAFVYSTVTAALLQPDRPASAVRFDSPASLNRPGPGGAWQRRAERRAFARAALLLPWGDAAARAAESSSTPRVSVHVPIEPVEHAPERDIDAVAYAGYPRKRGLELLCAAWAQAAPAGARLRVGGIERVRALAWLARHGVAEPDGVEWLAPMPHGEWQRTVARARLFVNASRREDHGIAQLEALAAGCALVTVPSPGPYEALPMARELAPALVARAVSAPALAEALRAGLTLTDEERSGYAAAADTRLAPYRRDAVRAVVAERVLPALVGREG